MNICARKSPDGDHMCWRAAGHLGLHRNAPSLRKATYVWGNNEYPPEQRETPRAQ